MNHPLLAASLAALALSSSACREDVSRTPHPQLSGATSTHRLDPPATASPGSNTHLSGADAGIHLGTHHSAPVLAAAGSHDPLALAHEDGRVVDHLARVNVLRSQGDLAGALLEARRAHFDDPKDEDVLSAIDAIAHLSADHATRALALERQAQLRPDDALPLIQQARVLIALGQHDRAVEVATAALLRDANHPEAYHAIGRAHLSKGELAPAITLFEKVLSLVPDHGYALNNLGFALLRANRNEEAVDVLTRASDLLPHVAYVFNNLGVALERTDRLDEARAAYAQASFLSPRYVKAQVNSARLAALSLPADLEEVLGELNAHDTPDAHDTPEAHDSSDSNERDVDDFDDRIDPTGHTGHTGQTLPALE